MIKRLRKRVLNESSHPKTSVLSQMNSVVWYFLIISLMVMRF